MSGKIHLIIGCMFSGKTTELISRYNKYNVANKKCIMVKPSIDNRYEEDYVVSHDNIKIQACKISKSLKEIENLLNEYDVICVDEVQFIDDIAEMSDKLANKGKTVILCGLNGNYNRKQFKSISELIPISEEIILKKAICKETGKSATFTKRLINDTQEILIGSDDIYSAVDRKTYFVN